MYLHHSPFQYLSPMYNKDSCSICQHVLRTVCYFVNDGNLCVFCIIYACTATVSFERAQVLPLCHLSSLSLLVSPKIRSLVSHFPSCKVPVDLEVLGAGAWFLEESSASQQKGCCICKFPFCHQRTNKKLRYFYSFLETFNWSTRHCIWNAEDMC